MIYWGTGKDVKHCVQILGGIIMQMREVQKEILENKKRHGFNITSIEQEICNMYGEVSEAYDAYRKGLTSFGEELADVVIFLLGIAEINKIDLGNEIFKRVYMITKCNKFQGGAIMQMKNVETGASVPMREVQKEIHANEVRQGFNITNMDQKFCDIYGEVSEAYDAYRKGLPTFGEELADVAIHLMGLAEDNGIDLAAEILRKVEINKGRKYQRNEKGYMIHE